MKHKMNAKKKKKKKKNAKHDKSDLQGVDSDRRGREIAAADRYPDLVKGCVVDRGRGPIVTFPRKKIRREQEEEEEADKRRNVS